MRTRTLLLLAVTCGLLILVAGGIFFLRLANQQDSVKPPLSVGDSGAAGDVTVTVESIDEADGQLTVTVVIGGIDDDDALDGFTLVGVPNPVEAIAEDSTCTAIAVAPTTCTVVFPTDAFTTEDRQLLFIRADERVRWILV
jgi:VCBS repeat-containing protein